MNARVKKNTSVKKNTDSHGKEKRKQKKQTEKRGKKAKKINASCILETPWQITQCFSMQVEPLTLFLTNNQGRAKKKPDT